MSAGPAAPSSKGDCIVVIRLGILRLLRNEAAQPFDNFLGWRTLGSSIFPRNKYGIESRGIQVGSFANSLHGLVVGAAGKPGGTQSDQHADGMRIKAVALGENFYGGFRCVMQQQFRSPIKRDRASRGSDSAARWYSRTASRESTQFLLHIAEQVMELSLVMMRAQGLGLVACPLDNCRRAPWPAPARRNCRSRPDLSSSARSR